MEQGEVRNVKAEVYFFLIRLPRSLEDMLVLHMKEKKSHRCYTYCLFADTQVSNNTLYAVFCIHSLHLMGTREPWERLETSALHLQRTQHWEHSQSF